MDIAVNQSDWAWGRQLLQVKSLHSLSHRRCTWRASIVQPKNDEISDATAARPAVQREREIEREREGKGAEGAKEKERASK